MSSDRSVRYRLAFHSQFPNTLPRAPTSAEVARICCRKGSPDKVVGSVQVGPARLRAVVPNSGWLGSMNTCVESKAHPSSTTEGTRAPRLMLPYRLSLGTGSQFTP